MSQRVVAIIQARMGSSRLPGKSLRPVAGRPLIAHVVERACACAAHAVVLATTTRPEDDELAAVAGGLGSLAFVVRGHPTDVLDRVRVAARLAKADVVLRITGDCPLWLPGVGTEAIAAWTARRRDLGDGGYVWNDTSRSGYPDGTDVEVFSRDALEHAGFRARRSADREHVTSFIRRHEATWTLGAPGDWSWLKLSVDTAEDLARVQRIAAALPRGEFGLAATVAAAQAVLRRGDEREAQA